MESDRIRSGASVHAGDEGQDAGGAGPGVFGADAISRGVWAAPDPVLLEEVYPASAGEAGDTVREGRSGGLFE